MNKAKATENMSMTYKPSNKFKMMMQGSFIGIARVMVGFPLEHPIDAIKVQW